MVINKLLLQVIIGCTLLFCFMVLLIRAQPYDDHDLRTFLMPSSGCVSPCFMSIQPGVTTEIELMSILESHDWVASLQRTSPSAPSIRWEWSGAQPAFIDPQQMGEARLGSDGLVNGIYVQTTIPFVWLRHLLGLPTWFNTYSYEFRTRTYYFGYPAHHLLLWVKGERCGGLDDLLHQPTSFGLLAQLIESPYAFSSPYVHDATLYSIKRKTNCLR
ncbi:MAG: hypothetical protein K8L99_13760 [Anaerolineae bacterium]|nr:hypothetical protein [Anaerolineae bacterium]